MTVTTPSTAGLAALEERLKQDLAWLELPSKSWVPRRVVDGEGVVDVVIVGAGGAGMRAALDTGPPARPPGANKL